MATPLQEVTLAVNAGFDALAHVPPHPVTLVPTIADSLLPLETQQELTRILGPIPSPSLFLTGDVTVAGPFKVVWTIYGSDNCEWTETYYTNTGGSPYAIAQGLTALATLRAAFLANVFTIGPSKISDTLNPRASFPQKIGVKGLAPIATPPGLGPPEIALVYRLFSSTGLYTNHYFRGWPANQINNVSGDGVFTPPALDPAVKAFAAALVVGGYGWSPITPAPLNPGQQYSKNPIKTVDGTVNQYFPTITCQNLINPGARALCNISSLDKKRLPGLNGTWQMFNVSANTFQVQYTMATADLVHVNGGYIRNNERATFVPFGTPPGFPAVAYFHGQGERKVKNLFGRGRRARYAPGIRTLA